MLGGLMLMAVGAAGLAGWAVGIHFHYPIVLFVVGLVGFFRGLITGNVTGKYRRQIAGGSRTRVCYSAEHLEHGDYMTP